jgi:adenylate cyclase
MRRLNTNAKRERRWIGRWKGVVAVVLIAMGALAVSLATAPLLRTIEESTVDIRMRWRLRLLPAILREDTGDLVLLAIDEKTEAQAGRFGAGRWLSRQPFLDQLRFLQAYCRPSVLAYDIILKEMAGDSETPEAAQKSLASSIDALTGLMRGGGRDGLPSAVLESLSVLVLQQANRELTHMLAEIQENDVFQLLLGCNLRGGWDAPPPEMVTIPYWSESDPASPGPFDYMMFLAIPDADIHFPTPAAREAYGYAPNGGLPTRDFLDYSLPGVLNVPRDADGVVRRVPLVMGIEDRAATNAPPRRCFVPTFALLSVLLHHGLDQFPLAPGTLSVEFSKAITMRLSDRTVRIPIDALGQMRLNYRWAFDDFAALSFSETAPAYEETTPEVRLAKARQVAPPIRGRVAVVGVTTTGIDVGPTPVHPNIPLVYAQLTAINTILNRAFLHTLSPWQTTWLMALCVSAFMALALAVRTVRVAGALVLTLLAYWIATYGALHYDLAILPVVPPTVFFLSGSFGLLTFRYLTEARERRKIRGMFSTMVSDRVLEWLEDHPESFSLEGHTTSATVMFSDIADFTHLSEGMAPANLIRLLNMYLTPVTDVILKAGGYLDKYVGDSVMGVWGAPYYDAQHALRACQSALAQQEILETLNGRIESEFGLRLRVRMGINSGEVTAGNMGSERKCQYTVIGDSVNLASRIEPINRDVGCRILVGEATQALISDHLETRQIGKFVVAGRDRAVTLYELLGKVDDISVEQRARYRQYEHALAAFCRREWNTARELLEAILAAGDDGPSRWLLARISECELHPPPPDWDGVYWRVQKV